MSSRALVTLQELDERRAPGLHMTIATAAIGPIDEPGHRCHRVARMHDGRICL
jgi:hypothetical protein